MRYSRKNVFAVFGCIYYRVINCSLGDEYDFTQLPTCHVVCHINLIVDHHENHLRVNGRNFSAFMSIVILKIRHFCYSCLNSAYCVDVCENLTVQDAI